MSIRERIQIFKDNYLKTHSKHVNGEASSSALKRCAPAPNRKPIVQKLRQNLSKIKRFVPLGVILFAFSEKAHAEPEPNPTARQTQSTASYQNALDQLLDIEQKVSDDIHRLWGHMNRYLDILQDEIRTAKKGGYKARAVRNLSNYVSPGSNLNTSYCVAGAMYVRKKCQDNLLNTIMPTAHDAGSKGNPVISCDASIAYFHKTLGARTAERGQRNFQTVLQNLKPGDLIFVYSSRAPSGKHCMTVAGTLSKGKIYARGVNNERSYYVSANKIAAAVNIMDEYRDRLTSQYLANAHFIVNERSGASAKQRVASNDTIILEQPRKAPVQAVSTQQNCHQNTQPIDLNYTHTEVNQQNLPVYSRYNLNEGEEALSEPLPTFFDLNKGRSQE